ncbi:MAG: CRISPR-associated endonuclease Cas2 [Candidatus Kerfeldbacteria bacterium]|nr:CRISPR-associated endonuclease Cas2 [Candidatus Kerfeldbacteria bacterium]
MSPLIPKHQLTKIALELMAEVGQAGIDYYNFFAGPKYFGWKAVGRDKFYIRGLMRLRKRAQAQQVLSRLRQAKYATAQQIGKKIMVSLTDKGRRAVLTSQLLHALPRTDKLATVVIFDIPEDQRVVRRELRWFLRQSGFQKLQQSVWIHWGDVYQPMLRFIQDAKAKRWVNVFHACNFSSIKT